MTPGLPWWLRRQRICLQCGTPGFDPWVGKIHWRREWHPTQGFLPGKFHGEGRLAGYSPWDCKESDMIEQLTQWQHTFFFFFLPPDTGRVLRKHLYKIHSNPRHIKCEERRLELRKYGNVSASFFSIFMCQSESPRLHVPVTLLRISYGSPLKQVKTWSKVNVSNNYNTINGNFIIISCGVYKSRDSFQTVRLMVLSIQDCWCPDYLLSNTH